MKGHSWRNKPKMHSFTLHGSKYTGTAAKTVQNIYTATAIRLVGSSVNVGHRYSVAVHVSWNAEISNHVDPS